MAIHAGFTTFLRRWRRVGLLVGGLYAVWVLFGFFLVPLLLRGRLERQVSQVLHRPVAIQRVRFNPIVLTVSVEGLRIPNQDGSEWITLRHLGLDYQLRRLVTRTVYLAAVELEGLVVRVELDAKGRLNFQDLLEEEPAPATPAATPSNWTFAIGRFQLRNGQLAFSDRSGAAPFQTILGPLSFRVDGLRTELGHRSGVTLEAWTEAKERLLWKGDLGLQPLASKGSLLIERLSLPKYRPYEQEQVASQFQSGTADLQLEYRFEWSKQRRVVALSNLGLTLRDLRLGEPGVAEPALELPLLVVQGGQADLLAPSVELGTLLAERGVLRLQRAKDGGLNLTRLLAPVRPRQPDPGAKPLRLLIRDLTLKGFRVAWDDQLPLRPVRAEATDLNLHWQGLSLDPTATSRAALSLQLGTGSLQAEGTVAALKPAGDLRLKVEGLALAPFDPYLDGALDLRLTSGSLGALGRLRFDLAGPGGLSYEGSASLQGLEARDGDQNEPFLRWKQLRLSGAEVRTAPLAVKIQAVEWVDPEGRLVIRADGSSNVARALRLEPVAQPVPVTAAVVPATPATAVDLTIAKVAIRGGRLSYIDRAVQPQAALVLTDLEGSYTGLSSRPEAASQVAFTGRAGGLAPITISGRAMPLRHDLDTDVVLRIQGADLTDFTPYTGKYLGYTVQKGKLHVDSRLRIDHRQLKAENAVKLDQFYLGEKVQSPDATGLPVKLGLAILRDRKGVIAFDLPVEGSLDDPDVKYGKLVWKAVFGLLGKIATSPFTLLGKLFGGDAGDLSRLAFPPGVATLDPAGIAKLQALAKALQERPELRLEAEGAVDATLDGAVLRKAALEALLRKTRSASQKVDEGIPVPAVERERWLKATYDVVFPPPKDGQATAPPPPAEMELRLLGSLPADPSDLASLADARVKGVLAWLLTRAQVDPGRVFQVRTGQAQGATVAFALK
jgi:uncharacterized protein involved in outer membrane biogenesis